LVTLEKIRGERTREFFDELAKGNILVDSSLLESEDFLHCYFATVKYALNSRRREKSKMFARLLKSSVTGEGPHGVDEYEDFLNILDELSYRELWALTILDQYQFSDKERTSDQNDAQWAITFWEEFIQCVSNELSIPPDEVIDFLKRISRTGCYELITGWGFPNNGKVTPTYRRLKNFILESSET